jgi:hypothetical protein
MSVAYASLFLLASLALAIRTFHKTAFRLNTFGVKCVPESSSYQPSLENSACSVAP